MTTNQAYDELENLTEHSTTVINGHVVTRWSAESFEIGTCGIENLTVDIDEAADVILCPA